ncbi:Glycosyltransferases involved in cell wall biogenesis [Prochlorococcus marinus str. MIT 9515]|uniref:4,4'-diaponeurosporenoate glycosyltransferase n=1 Tax=Prochlorococcus marinus (strain MIT 9515) TaxID=167542 RepID=A2BVM5_PROM5|nr:TIGR04283 family arsenosugar biosynthesis glycosyltransferase [Prochlorococcus marinus]ABM71836.1 Glycosyltransferases involved in cell wall biogenesis [Prochlorococcus marinus str. MIT 9515]
MPKISIIIPTYNESQHLSLLLSDLSIFNEGIEIIIVDCNSEDKTRDIAKFYRTNIFKSKEKNRGLQLNLGAKKAKGEWFIFIHADSRLSKGWLKKVKSVIRNKENFIYFFKFKINNEKLIYRFLEIVVNLRSFFLKDPYGDQGLIIHRRTYFKNNGYRKIPLMEDLDFIKRLKNNEHLKMLTIPIYTSSRKWEKTNIISQAFKNWNFRKRWLRGESIKSLYNDYYKKLN